MKSGALLGLALLAVVSTAAVARADDAPAPASCEVPDSLLVTESVLNKVADAVKGGHSLDILVVGSRSSTITASEGSAYPARLQLR